MICALPPPTCTVSAPKTIAVSAAANFEGCGLKVIAASRDLQPLLLSSGPEAAIGTLIHAVLERAAPDNAAEVFDAELQRLQLVLSANPKTAHFSNLPATRSYMEWRHIRAAVLARCQLLSSHKAKPDVIRSLSAGDVRPGREARLDGIRLPLVGRCDVLERTSAKHWIVREFKSGRTNEPDGTVRAAIRRQLYLYALILLEHHHDSRITLVLEKPGASLEIPWGAEQKREAEVHIARLLALVRPGVTVEAAGAAHPGAECSHCRFRHRCEQYIKQAPFWWREIPTLVGEVPADSWGKVVAISEGKSKHCIELIDDAGRHVRVTGLRPRVGLDGAIVGRHFFAFGLERTGTGTGWTGKKFQPQTFHETAADKTERSSYATELFFGATPDAVMS